MVTVLTKRLDQLESTLQRVSNWQFAIGMSLLFWGLAFLGILQHEMWSDEMMFWMIARDNPNFNELLTTLRFEYMHPFLWGVLLNGISRFTRAPIAMQLFHILIATVNVFLLCRFAPFTRLQKILLSFSYFLFYEYSIISRNYGLGVLMIFLFCVLFPSRKRSYLGLAGILALMANVNFYSRMTAIALAAMLVLEWWRDHRQQPTSPPRWNLLVSSFVLLAGLALSAIQNVPPDTGGAPVGSVLLGGLRWQAIVSAIANLWKAYFPMPGLALRFWNSNIIDDGYAAALFWIPLGFSIALFYRRPLILFLYLFNLTEIVVFHSMWVGLMRHLGHVFVVFVVCLWLAPAFPVASDAKPLARHPIWAFFQRYQTQFLSAVLVVQVIAGAYAYTMDLFNPFSQARMVAQQVRQMGLSDRFIAGAIDAFTQSFSGYLDRPIFYPERNRLGTYISSDHRAQRLEPNQLLSRVATTATTDTVLLVLNSPLPTPLPTLANWNLQSLPALQPAIVKVENYHLYLMQRLN